MKPQKDMKGSLEPKVCDWIPGSFDLFQLVPSDWALDLFSN